MTDSQNGNGLTGFVGQMFKGLWSISDKEPVKTIDIQCADWDFIEDDYPEVRDPNWGRPRSLCNDIEYY